jgi:hypothetical protein
LAVVYAEEGGAEPETICNRAERAFDELVVR